MIVKKGFIAEGAVCDSCEKIIKKQAMQVKGVKKVTYDYSTEVGEVEFDDKKTNIDEILSKIEEKNYSCFILDESQKKKSYKKTLGWIFSIIGIFIIGYFILNLVGSITIPTISQNMSFGLLFVVGLLTGFHCIGMCGGFVVSYTAKNAQEGKKSHKSHIMYGIGKTLSYTIIGALFGLLGSIISFTPKIRGVVGLLAGLFLILFGLKMLNLIPFLRKIRIKSPKFISKFVGKNSNNSSPLIIGLLNGLMIACGPLQAIYIMAAGTGSFIIGAKLLFVFGLGTLPAMLGFGYFASYVSGKVTHRILKASGVLVIILGIFMLNNGLVLTGSGYDFNSVMSLSKSNELSDSGIVMKDGFQEIRMDVVRSGYSPDTFVLEKGVPVKWIINGKELTGCNNAIQVPKYDLEFDINEGEQIIEFTPTEEGVVRWSCWMGMIPGTFIVKENIENVNIKEEIEAVPKPQGGSCGGSCGCGG
jgi:uncharacterized protein